MVQCSTSSISVYIRLDSTHITFESGTIPPTWTGLFLDIITIKTIIKIIIIIPIVDLSKYGVKISQVPCEVPQ